MMLSDLPELQGKIGDFLESGTDLTAALSLYESHGVNPVPEPVVKAVQDAAQALRGAVEERAEGDE